VRFLGFVAVLDPFTGGFTPDAGHGFTLAGCGRSSTGGKSSKQGPVSPPR
jgi:hypothetical protein